MFLHQEHVWFIGCVFYTSCPTCAFFMPWSIFCFLILILSMSCLFYALQHFFRCFVFFLALFSHSSCTPHASLSLFISSFLSLIFLGPFVYSCQKGGEYTREYTKKYCHFYMALDHILKGRNCISFAHSQREKVLGEMHIPWKKTFFIRKPYFVLFYFMFVFLLSLWCFDLHLISMLCCSYHIVFMCWTCIHPYAFVLY